MEPSGPAGISRTPSRQADNPYTGSISLTGGRTGPPTSSPSAWPTRYLAASWMNWQPSKRPGNDNTLDDNLMGRLSRGVSQHRRLRRDFPTARESRARGLDDAWDELARQLQERIERWLDQGMGSCVLKQASLAAFLTSAMHHFDDDRYELDGYVVMPNHAHAIVQPRMSKAHPIETIVGSWKKYSSRRIDRGAPRNRGPVAGRKLRPPHSR